MYARETLQKQLLGEAKSQLFQEKLEEAIFKAAAEKKAQADVPLAAKMDDKDYFKKSLVDKRDLYAKPFAIEGDDNLNSKMWASLKKDSAHYFDCPTVDQERQMREKLQLRYDSILPVGWRPPLQSRKDLLFWSCQKHTEYLKENNQEVEFEDCFNHHALVEKYGPDYSALRKKLGHVRGLFD